MELRKDLLITVVKMLLVIAVLFALWALITGDAPKAISQFFIDITKTFA